MLHRKEISKNGQIAIFIVIGIVIVLSIVLYFILIRHPSNPSINSRNIDEYMQKCASDSVKQALEIMLPQGGRLNPENYFLYKERKIEYLCYQKNNYLPCNNLYPLLIKSFEDEIDNYISPRINSCFNSVKRNLEAENYNVEMNNEGIDVSFYPGQIRINMDKSIALEKSEERISYNNFSSVIISPVYELLNIAIEIVNGQAQNCEFDYSSYERSYPDVNIDKIFTENSNQIWTLEKDEQELIFAVRSCALPGAF